MASIATNLGSSHFSKQKNEPYESNGLSRVSQSMIGVSQPTYSKLSHQADTNWA